MRPTLARSAFVVTLFWWIVGLVKFSAGDPANNLSAARRLAETLPWLGLDLPESVAAHNAIHVQIQVLSYWTLPFLLVAATIALIGYSSVWISAFSTHRQRVCREQGKGDYRGLRVNLGAFPQPPELPRRTVKLKAAGPVATALGAMPEGAAELTREVLGTIAAHSEAYVGEGHGEVTLLEHTLRVMRKGFEIEDMDPLLPLVLAAHDLGKITSYLKRGGSWVVTRMHDKESARLMTLLPSYVRLCEEDRTLARLAVRYSHSIWQAPVEESMVDRLKGLVSQMKQADGKATGEEKSEFLENLPLPEMVWRAFSKALCEVSLQVPGLPRKIKAAGWKVGDRLYLLELAIHKAAMKHLDSHTRAALGENYRQYNKIAPFSMALMEQFNERGCLVKRVGEAKLGWEDALWKIRAGSLEFNGVIIIDLAQAEELKALLPGEDTLYEIEVLAPMFVAPGMHVISGGKLPDAILGSKKPAKTNAPGEKKAPVAPDPPEPESAAGESAIDELFGDPPADSSGAPAPASPLPPADPVVAFDDEIVLNPPQAEKTNPPSPAEPDKAEPTSTPKARPAPETVIKNGKTRRVVVLAEPEAPAKAESAGQERSDARSTAPTEPEAPAAAPQDPGKQGDERAPEAAQATTDKAPSQALQKPPGRPGKRSGKGVKLKSGKNPLKGLLTDKGMGVNTAKLFSTPARSKKKPAATNED
ncbi:HD domain-containing protein [Thioalkalivibrio thiocyanodenitrificans]|uniref:HD domain-containing protein n=1 Tax=Thioalkalivibrio thiocyanodenitrificans TaxID=243063 RepID=UPI00039A7A1F|nr:HD domain-containing protein [Thioalkalivibrio thiocyanodenitrificans]